VSVVKAFKLSKKQLIDNNVTENGESQELNNRLNGCLMHNNYFKTLLTL